MIDKVIFSYKIHIYVKRFFYDFGVPVLILSLPPKFVCPIKNYYEESSFVCRKGLQKMILETFKKTIWSNLGEKNASRKFLKHFIPQDTGLSNFS